MPPPTPASRGSAGASRVAGWGGVVLTVVVVLIVRFVARSAVRSVFAHASDGPVLPGITASPEATQDRALLPDQQVIGKLTPYITQCINIFSSPVHQSRSRYLNWTSATDGPTGRERTVLRLIRVSDDPATCAAAATQAAQMQPSMPDVEAAAQRYVTALQAVHPLLEEAYAYYSRQNYRDGEMARGRTMHAPLMQAFNTFEEASQQFVTAVEHHHEQATTQFLARLQRDPSRQFEYRLRSNHRLARQIVNLIDTARISDKGFIEGVDPAALISLIDTYESGIDAAARDAVALPSEASAAEGYSSYARASGEFLAAVKAFARRLRDHVAYDLRELERPSAEFRDGFPQRTVQRFENLGRAYNSLF